MEVSVEARKAVKSRKSDKEIPRNKKKSKVLTFDFDEDDDVKPPSKRRLSDDDEEEVPISRLKKRRKSLETESDVVLGFETQGDGDDMVAVAGDALGLAVDDDLLLTPFSGFQTQETDDNGEAQERRVKPRAASSLPIVFGEKVTKTKVLLECEGDAVDLSGDMGAVGRFTVDRDQEISLDLKGIIYKTTIVPSNTFFVVNVGQTEAKVDYIDRAPPCPFHAGFVVECIMSDFVQLRADTNCNENETMVEGTLKDFGFDSDEEREHLAINGGEKPDTTEKVKHEEGADDGEQPKEKEKAPKAPKIGKVPVKKAAIGKSKVGRVATAKGVGKKHAAKAPKPKASKK